jgi:hypothetical protein
MSSIEFTLKAIQDGDSRVALKDGQVELELEGPRHMIEQAEKDLVFEVQELAKNVINQGGASFITFRKDNLRHRSKPELDKLVKSMTPSTVRILLEKNAKKPLAFDRENIQLIDVDENLNQRIRKTTFDPPTLDIFGPEDKLPGVSTKTRLFRGTFSETDIRDGSRVLIKLQRTTDEDLTWLQLEPIPTVTFEIEPEWQEYILPNVPVDLDTFQVGAELLADYEVEPRTVTVKIRATGKLTTLLWKWHETIVVDQEMVHKHARLRVYLRKSDLDTDGGIQRRPTIQLFTVNALDAVEQMFVIDVDFKQPEQTSIIIKKKTR